MKTQQIISVQASAGSGKTYNLAKRYIELLFDDNKSKNIIAVTFANKASIEMKQRVLDYLKKGALGMECGGIFDDLNLSKKAISIKSAKLLDEIINNYDDFHISTIDSFKNYILKACAINLDISPNFQIKVNHCDYLKFAIDSFLQNASRNKESDLMQIAMDYVVQYTFAKKSWFARSDIFTEMNKLFKKISNTGKELNYDYSGVYWKTIYEKSDELYLLTKKAMEIIDKNKFNINNTCLKSFNKALSASKHFLDLEFSSYYFYDLPPYNAKSEQSAQLNELWSQMKRSAQDLLEFDALNYYGIYCKLYEKIREEFAYQSKKDELVFINEINSKTLKLFESKETIPEIYYRLSEKYNHFLIDEFQDTNTVQWTGFKKLIEEVISKDGSFFFVGDIKQAVYGFRGGNSDIMLNMDKEFPFADIDYVSLENNYRSQKSIIDFNNSVFSKENLSYCFQTIAQKDKEANDFSKLLAVYENCAQKSGSKKDGGFVKFEIIPNAEDKEIIEENIKVKFLDFVKDVSARYELEDIAVLCRSNRDNIQAANWLMESGFETESMQTMDIRANACVKQILSLIRFLASPIDSLSFASFILGDVFSKITGIDGQEIEKFIFDFKKSKVLYKVFRERYSALWEEYFEYFFKKSGFIPVYELTISILEKFKVMENFGESKVFILRFLELIKNFEKDDAGLNNFIHYLSDFDDDENEDRKEDLYIKTRQGGGIKVMTFHKAKGLQFPVVIIPFLEIKNSWEDPYYREDEKTIKLIRTSKAKTHLSDTDISTDYNLGKAQNLLWEFNLVYVAMTRAEDEMYILVPPKAGNSNNLAAVLLEKVEKETGIKSNSFAFRHCGLDPQSPSFVSKTLCRGITDQARNGGKKVIKKIIQETVEDSVNSGYKDLRISFKTDSFFSLNSDKAKRQGAMKHFALSQLLSLKNKNLDDEIKRIVDLTIRKYRLADETELKTSLKEFLSNKEISAIFDFDFKLVSNEKEIVSSQGITMRIDKMIILDDKVLIYDFKNSLSNIGEYKEQISKYINAVKEIYTDKIVEGYIVALNEKQIEAV
ncbi:MAG: UvrD-helicase domain-containing protein [Elusimicrobiota bacterium]|jgi:ATP-dependent exoDNAse (exonuclease V) beta subunit|nr:UvrD-helicase domain-containing protein [Elusimicrobiota bacterium]